MNSYESRRQEKIERFERAASLSLAAADATGTRARKMADVIPFGQPILVGHHSERRDWNYRAKINKRFDKAIELREKAQYYPANSFLAIIGTHMA